jgi:hypothetical protein
MGLAEGGAVLQAKVLGPVKADMAREFLMRDWAMAWRGYAISHGGEYRTSARACLKPLGRGQHWGIPAANTAQLSGADVQILDLSVSPAY